MAVGFRLPVPNGVLYEYPSNRALLRKGPKIKRNEPKLTEMLYTFAMCSLCTYVRVSVVRFFFFLLRLRKMGIG